MYGIFYEVTIFRRSFLFYLNESVLAVSKMILAVLAAISTHLDNSLWSMRNLYANFWDVNFSIDSSQLSLTNKFEIIGEIALSKFHNFGHILQFLPGICATMKPGNVSADYIGH